MSPYNDVYKRLSDRAEKDNEPLIGMVAYAIYKRTKVEYCCEMDAAGTPVSPEDLRDYHKRCTGTVLESFEKNASEVVLQYGEDYLERNRDRIVQETLGHMQEDLQASFKQSTNFLRGFWSGFASSIAATIFIIIMTMAGASIYPDFIRSFLKAIVPTAQ
ncbi:MAG: hypothetical protein HQL94_08495 [Magnetococcales bacterium]|nr:hypothetical protein [Magnetococcales bacterium]MBF0438573.1 hypothetical protein [Magnetococcales bacterium]